MTPFRESYWNIDPVWLFYLLAAAAVAIFGYGLQRHILFWQKGLKQSAADLSFQRVIDAIMEVIAGKRIFRNDLGAGIMHMLIMCGFTVLFIGTVLIAADYWIFTFLRGSVYLFFSLLMDLAGVLLMGGLIWALIRRYISRVPRLERHLSDLIVPAGLILVVASGYMTEASRLAAQQPAWAGWSIIGNAIGAIWSSPATAINGYRFFWWAHACLSLALIAYIPYSKLFHILAAPLSVYLKDTPLPVLPVEQRQPDAASYSLREAIFMDACTRCGRCVEVCPVSGAGEPFAPRDFVLWAAERLSRGHLFSPEKTESSDQKFAAERLWHCTTCRACLEVCPVHAAIPDAVRNQRSGIVEDGTQVPELLTQALKKINKYNNPWEATKKKRDKWADDLDIVNLTQKKAAQEVTADGFCYFVGCTTSMDTRAQALARSFVNVLDHAQVSFGTLGKKEPCCGDIARRAGEDGLFEMKMEDTCDLFRKYDIREVVTSSPHCYHTFKNDYAAYRNLMPQDEQVRFNVRHYSHVLADLLDRKLLVFQQSCGKKITYHDPCYLGRYNGLYDLPRRIISAIPGVELTEMKHNRTNSLCCGGGGARMWQEDLETGPKMSEIRIREAAETGAEILITACPLCLIMLEDARKTAGLEDRLRVMDLNELVVDALRLG